MNTIITADEVLFQTPHESRRYSFDFSGVLADGDSLTGTPVLSVTPSGPTLGTPAINGVLVDFRISTVTAGVDYVVGCKCTTTGGDTLEGYGDLLGRSG